MLQLSLVPVLQTRLSSGASTLVSVFNTQTKAIELLSMGMTLPWCSSFLPLSYNRSCA